MGGCLDGWMRGWIDEWMRACVGGWLGQYHVVDAHSGV